MFRVVVPESEERLDVQICRGGCDEMRQIESLDTAKWARSWFLGLRARKRLLLSGPLNVRCGGVSGLLLWLDNREERLGMVIGKDSCFLVSWT
jgi:hypothetical protein